MKTWMWVVIAIVAIIIVVVIIRKNQERRKLAQMQQNMQTTNMASLLSYVGNLFKKDEDKVEAPLTEAGGAEAGQGNGGSGGDSYDVPQSGYIDWEGTPYI